MGLNQYILWAGNGLLGGDAVYAPESEEPLEQEVNWEDQAS